jgi:hypothetical protein
MRTRIVAAGHVATCLLVISLARPAAAGPSTAGHGRAALTAAARAQKYLFLLFWKEDDPATRAMRQTLEAFIASQGRRASWVGVRTGDPVEKNLVDQFGVSRAPLPLVLTVAPNGAVTGGFPLKVTAARLAQALVSPAMARCLKALQSRKLVLLCVRPKNQAIPAGAQAFQADPQYQPHTELVSLNAADPGEAATLRQFQLAPQPATAVTLLLAPPGGVLGKFKGDVSKQQLLDKLKAARCGC